MKQIVILSPSPVILSKAKNLKKQVSVLIGIQVIADTLLWANLRS